MSFIQYELEQLVIISISLIETNEQLFQQLCMGTAFVVNLPRFNENQSEICYNHYLFVLSLNPSSIFYDYLFCLICCGNNIKICLKQKLRK